MASRIRALIVAWLRAHLGGELVPAAALLAQGSLVGALALLIRTDLSTWGFSLFVLFMSAGLVGFASAHAGVTALGPELGAFVGALCVGLLAGAYARFARRPALIVLLPGVVLLVPGSLGFRSVSSFLETNAIDGVQGAFTMLIVATSLVVGLLSAAALTPPRAQAA